MRAAVLEKYGDDLHVYDDVEYVPVAASQVRVRIRACGVCHSDLHMGGGFTPTPLIPGHEAAGEIEAIGDGVTGLQVGDRVAVAPMPSCGHCRTCLEGHPSLCEGTRNWPQGTLADGRAPFMWRGQEVRRGNGVGAFADSVIVGAEAAIPIPDDLPFQLACLLSCAVQTGVGAVLNTAQVRPGSSVLVMGLGGVGLAIVQGARIAGATTIIACDPVESRRAAASELGATQVVDPAAQDVARLARAEVQGVHYAFDAVGAPTIVDTCFRATGYGGRIILVGAPPSDARLEGISQGLVVGHEKAILGSMMGSANPSRDIPFLVRLWRAGLLNLDSLITAERPLTEVGAALDDLRSGIGIRTILTS
jgi:S-(hydroxymethyl)glutathione dehydrogenase / alcohol dehydrogenase